MHFHSYYVCDRVYYIILQFFFKVIIVNSNSKSRIPFIRLLLNKRFVTPSSKVIFHSVEAYQHLSKYVGWIRLHTFKIIFKPLISYFLFVLITVDQILFIWHKNILRLLRFFIITTKDEEDYGKLNFCFNCGCLRKKLGFYILRTISFYEKKWNLRLSIA